MIYQCGIVHLTNMDILKFTMKRGRIENERNTITRKRIKYYGITLV